MGLVRRLVTGFSAYGTSRPRDPQTIVGWLPRSFAGFPLTVDDALALSTVWACVSAITGAIATRKWNVFRPDGPGRRVILPDDRIAYILNARPNPDMTAIAWREAMLMSALVTGNAYSEIVLDGAYRPVHLWPFESDRVTPKRDPETWELYYEISQPNGGTIELPQNRVFHLKGPGLNGLMGEHIVNRAATSLALAVAAERYASTYYGNNTVIDTVIEYPNALNDAARKAAREALEDRHQGAAKAHRPLILSNGAKMQVVSHNAEQSQVVESRKFSVEEICRWFGVPPHKVQHLERMTFNNVEELGIDFVRGLEPWARRLEQEADYKLFPQTRGPWRQTEINLTPLTQGNAKTRAEAQAIMRQNGLRTANELRAEDGENAIPGPEGDALLVQTNMTTVEKLLQAPPPGSAPAPKPPRDAPEDGGAGEEDMPEPMDALVRKAVTAMSAGALERYAKRIENRRADLVKRHPADVVASSIAEERKRLRPWIAAELQPARSVLVEARGGALLADVTFAHAVETAASSIDNGTDARAVAAAFVSALEAA